MCVKITLENAINTQVQNYTQLINNIASLEVYNFLSFVERKKKRKKLFNQQKGAQFKFLDIVWVDLLLRRRGGGRGEGYMLTTYGKQSLVKEGHKESMYERSLKWLIIPGTIEMVQSHIELEFTKNETHEALSQSKIVKLLIFFFFFSSHSLSLSINLLFIYFVLFDGLSIFFIQFFS